MFDFIKKMLTETSNSNIAFAKLPVTYSCRHQGRGRSRYFDMLGPSALENYLQFLGTTKCAECAAVERAAKTPASPAPWMHPCCAPRRR